MSWLFVFRDNTHCMPSGCCQLPVGLLKISAPFLCTCLSYSLRRSVCLRRNLAGLCGAVKLDRAEDPYWTPVCYLHMLICTQEFGSSPGRLSQIPILGYTVLVLWATSVYGSLEESMNRCVYDRLFDNSFQKGFFHWLIVRECVKGTNTARHLPCPAARTDTIQSIV